MLWERDMVAYMDKLLVIKELFRLFQSQDYDTLVKEVADTNAVNVAEFLEELSDENRIFVFNIMDSEQCAEVLTYIDEDIREDIVEKISDEKLKDIIDNAFIDDAVDFLSDAPAELVSKVLRNTDTGRREIINRLLNYPENSAGSIMTVEYVELNIKNTVDEAMKIIKVTGEDKKTLYSCYVTDDNRNLRGVVYLKTLIFSKGDEIIKNLMNDDYISVNVDDDREYVAQLFKKYNLIAMPVTDMKGALVGIITIDDIVDVIDEESTEDIEKMSGLVPSEDEYLKTSVWTLSKNRILWLLILMVSGTLTGSIIGKYEDILSSVVILASFVPLLMDTGGNAGSQASTLIIRGMALGEIRTRDIFRVIWKEMRVGVLCGLCLGSVNFLRLMIFSHQNFLINFTVSLSIVCVVVVAKTVGCILPIIAKKLKIDPAIMAGPFISTVVDVITLLIFFNLSNIFIF